MKRWFPTLRTLVRLAHAHERIASASERIADHLTGVEPKAVAPEEVAMLAPRDIDFVRVERIRERLTRHLGHEPSDEQLVMEYEGEPYAGDEETTLPMVKRMRETGKLG